MHFRVLILLFIIVSAFPVIVSAQEEALLLSQQDNASILDLLQDYTSKVGVSQSIFSYSSEEQAILSLFRSSSRQFVVDFIPGFVSTETVELVIGVVSDLSKVSSLSAGDVVKEIEKTTVKKANEALFDWISGNEVKTSSGNIEYEYDNYRRQQAVANFQYVIAFQEISDDVAEVVVEFYSPDTIPAPIHTSSLGQSAGLMGDSPHSGEVSPFILTMSMEIERYAMGWRSTGSGVNDVSINFTDDVPRLSLSNNLPYPVEKQKRRLQNAWTIMKNAAASVGGVTSQATDSIGAAASSVAGSIGGAMGGVIDFVFGSPSDGLDSLSQDTDNSSSYDTNERSTNNSADTDPVDLSIGPASDEVDEDVVVQKADTPVRASGITLDYSRTVSPDNDLYVTLSANSLNEGPYDVKISVIDEDGTTLSRIYDDQENDWPSSVFYLSESVFGPEVVNDLFIIRFQQDRVEGLNGATVVAQLRESGSSTSSMEFSDSISFLIDSVEEDLNEDKEEEEDELVEPEVVVDFDGCSNGQMNINNASEAELQNLTGIGPSLAERIVDEAVNGHYFTVSDLQRVSGIGEVTVDDMIQQGLACADDPSVSTYVAPQKESSSTGSDDQDEVDDDTDEQNEDVEEEEDEEKEEEVLVFPVCSAGQINLNATKPEMMENITGIGPALSSRISEERGEGYFYDLDDLQRVSGIGSATVGNMREDGMACVGDPDIVIPPAVSFDENEIHAGSLDIQLSWDVFPGADQVEGFEISNTSSTGPVWYEQNGEWVEFGDGINVDGSTSSISLKGSDESTYSFDIMTLGDWEVGSTDSSQVYVSLPKQVVVNEVAWSGTGSDQDHQWIELHNPGSEDIDLNGWRLSSENTAFQIYFEDSDDFKANEYIIPSGGHYLMYRGDGAVVSDISPDVVYGGEQSLSLNGDTLVLVDDAGIIQDRVDCAYDSSGECTGWFAGMDAGVSMERINAAKSGSDEVNWGNNILVVRNGEDSHGDMVYGTPGDVNSVSRDETRIGYIPAMTFNEFGSVMLPEIASPYFIENGINIPPERSLTVDPGVRVHFSQNASLSVGGALFVNGTEEAPVLLRGEGSRWKGLYIGDASTGSEIEHVEIRGASREVSRNKDASVHVESSDLELDNVVITEAGSDYRLYLKNSDSIISESTFSGADSMGSSAALMVDGGSLVVRDSVISDSSYGVYIDSLTEEVSLEENTFSGNDSVALYDLSGGDILVKNNEFIDNRDAIRVHAMSSAIFEGNEATGNTYDGVVVTNSIGSDTVWKAHSLPYIVQSLRIAEGVELRLDPGVNILFANPLNGRLRGFIVEGSLVSDGSSEDPVIFSSLSSQEWHYIRFDSESSGSILRNTILENGGDRYHIKGSGNPPREEMIFVDGSDLLMQEVEVIGSPNVGLRVNEEGSVSGSSVTFKDNDLAVHAMTCPSLIGVTFEGNDQNLPHSLVCFL